jgi:UDP-glucose 4-epimerase
VSLVAHAFRGAGLVDFSPEQMRYLAHGRVVDGSRLAADFGWSPRPTAEAFQDFVGVAENRVLTPESAAAMESRLFDLVTGRRATLTGQGA